MANWTEKGVKKIVTEKEAAWLVEAGTHFPLSPNPCYQVVDGQSYMLLSAATPDGIDRLIVYR